MTAPLAARSSPTRALLDRWILPALRPPRAAPPEAPRGVLAPRAPRAPPSQGPSLRLVAAPGLDRSLPSLLRPISSTSRRLVFALALATATRSRADWPRRAASDSHHRAFLVRVSLLLPASVWDLRFFWSARQMCTTAFPNLGRISLRRNNKTSFRATPQGRGACKTHAGRHPPVLEKPVELKSPLSPG